MTAGPGPPRGREADGTGRTRRPDAGRGADAGRLDIVRSVVGRRSDPGRSDAGRADASRPDDNRGDGGRADAGSALMEPRRRRPAGGSAGGLPGPPVFTAAEFIPLATSYDGIPLKMYAKVTPLDQLR